MNTSSLFRWTVAGLVSGLMAFSSIQAQNTSNVSLPKGFNASVLLENLGGPRMMIWGPDGKLYVSEMGAGRVVRFSYQSGKASAVETVKEGLARPHGLAWYKDGSSTWLYIAEENGVQRYAFEGGKLGSGQRLLDLPRGGHVTRTVHFGPDGKMYVSIGSSSNKTPESDPRRAAILRYNPDGSIPADNPFASDNDARRRAVWAEGLRNAVDFTWTPSGDLWASTHGSDNVVLKAGDLPDNQPYEKIVNDVQKGKHYGWPFCIPAKLGVNTAQDKQIPDPTVAGSASYDCGKTVPPLLTTLAHAAPLGMAWGEASNFPAEYKSSLFIALHGSWNTDNPASYRDCKIERVIVQNGQPIKSETFANFKREANRKCGSAWGRPAGIVFAPDGSMLVADDAGGRILRIVYTGQ